MIGRMSRIMRSLRKSRKSRKSRKIRKRIRKVSKKGGRRRSIKKRLGRISIRGGSIFKGGQTDPDMGEWGVNRMTEPTINQTLIENTIKFVQNTKFMRLKFAASNIPSENAVPVPAPAGDWFLNRNNLLVNTGQNNNLSKDDTVTQKFVDSACILRHTDQEFTDVMEKVRTEPLYKDLLKLSKSEYVPDVDALFKRLIYNRPLVFYNPNDVGMTYWVPKKTPKGVGGEKGVIYNPLRSQQTPNNTDDKNTYNLKYELASLGSLIGCCCLTPITNSGNRTGATTQHNYEEKFFDKDKNYNTESYVCGLVGARFENSDQMESAYIIEEPTSAAELEMSVIYDNIPDVYRWLHEYFKGRMIKHCSDSSKQCSDSSVYKIKTLSYKEKLYRERIRFTFEIFIDQCIQLQEQSNVKICPVFTGLGAGAWKPEWIDNDTLLDILEDAILSALLSRHYVFKAIRFASMKQYSTTNVPHDNIAVSTDFNTKYAGSKYEDFLSKTTIFHNHFLGSGNIDVSETYNGNGTMFQTAKELHDLVEPPPAREQASEPENNRMAEQPVSTFDPDDIKYRECVLFAWDGNSFVGNEYWDMNFSGSGDPVTVCATALSQLCNPFINKQMLNKIAPDTALVGTSGTTTDDERNAYDMPAPGERKQTKQTDQAAASAGYETPAASSSKKSSGEVVYNKDMVVAGADAGDGGRAFPYGQPEGYATVIPASKRKAGAITDKENNQYDAGVPSTVRGTGASTSTGKTDGLYDVAQHASSGGEAAGQTAVEYSHISPRGGDGGRGGKIMHNVGPHQKGRDPISYTFKVNVEKVEKKEGNQKGSSTTSDLYNMTKGYEFAPNTLEKA